jgi:hypothetical protein
MFIFLWFFYFHFHFHFHFEFMGNLQLVLLALTDQSGLLLGARDDLRSLADLDGGLDFPGRVLLVVTRNQLTQFVRCHTRIATLDYVLLVHGPLLVHLLVRTLLVLTNSTSRRHV